LKPPVAHSIKPTPVRTASSRRSVKQPQGGLFLGCRLGARRNNYAKDACAYERANTHLPSKIGNLAMLLAMHRRQRLGDCSIARVGYPGGGRGAFPATSGRHLRIVSQVRSRLLSTGMSSEVSAATQIQFPSTWAARITPIFRLFPSALNVSPSATFGGGVNSSHERLVPAFIWRQSTFPSIATTD
jgi:hypothetical protein